MAQKRGFDFSIARQYDKLLAVLVLVGLLLSLFVLARFGTESRAREADHREAVNHLKPAVPLATPLDLQPYEQALKSLRHPRTMSVSTNETGLFIPERRVWCADCRYPIPYDATNCPFCRAKQPDLPVPPDPTKVSSSGDGIYDVWRQKYFGHPLAMADDHSLAADDADGDGFSNFDEFRAGTNPRDAHDHPDVAQLLRFKELRVRPFPFVFTSAMTMPDGKHKCAFNMKEEDRTYMVGEGQAIGKTGLILVKYVEKKERRPDPTLGGMTREVDLSEVTLRRAEDGKEFVLRIGEARAAMEQEVVFNLTVAAKTTVYRTAAGGTLDLQGQKYVVNVVIGVDGQPTSVVIQNANTGTKWTVPQ